MLILKADLSALGVFNQIYAVYVIFSQFAVLAINDSVQQSVSLSHDNKKKVELVKTSGLLLSSISGVIVATVLFFSAYWIGIFLDSHSVGEGLKLASLGLFFFSLNKVMLGGLNGQRKINIYSIIQIMRSVAILAFITLVVTNQWSAYMLGAAFTFSEVVIFFPLVISNFCPKITLPDFDVLFKQIFRHLKFGFKAFPNALLAEAYLKIDILMLSLFLSDKQVGIYSFAALFFEGICQIPVMIRTNVNPILVKFFLKNDVGAFKKFRQKIMVFSFSITLIALVLINLCFPFLAYFFNDNLIDHSSKVLIVLSIGLIFYSVFLPFDYSFIQIGKPEIQSFAMLGNIIVAISTNFFLIPHFGIIGAAIATSLTLLFAGLVLTVLFRVHRPFG